MEQTKFRSTQQQAHTTGQHSQYIANAQQQAKVALCIVKGSHFSGRLSRSRIWSLMMVSSLPSIGGTSARPPVAMRMFLAYIYTSWLYLGYIEDTSQGTQSENAHTET